MQLMSQELNDKCQMSNVYKVKLLSERTSGLSPVIFVIEKFFQIFFISGELQWILKDLKEMAQLKGTDATFGFVTGGGKLW